MNVVVVGANGGVGKEVVLQAARAGHHVIGVVREPQPGTKGVHYVVGSATDAAFIARIAKGSDVIVSTIGTTNYKKPVSLYSESTKAYIKGMPEAGMQRLIVLSAGGASVEPNDPLILKYVVKPLLWRFFRNLYDDMIRMEKTLASSDLQWTVVRLARLTDEPLTRRYQTARDKATPHGGSITRADAAHYIVHHMLDPKDYRHHICIANY